MCENCTTQNVENENIDKIEELNIDDSEILYYADPLLISTDNVEDVEFDKEEFIKGIKSASYDCGVFTALINSGMSNGDAIAYIFNLKNIDMNIKITEINAKATIEASKNQQVVIEKQQL